jgi:hypothetical protein
MRQWKNCLSFAVLGALAAPLAFGTYKARWPEIQTWIPLTDEVRRAAFERFMETNNCQDLVGKDAALESCRFNQKAFKEGGVYGLRPSLALHLAMNAAVAIAGFGTIFGLFFLIPALTRKYWKWLNT